MSKWSKPELEQMCEDIVNVLYPEMTEDMIFEYGQNGYPLNELVQKVIDRKNTHIEALKAGFAPVEI